MFERDQYPAGVPCWIDTDQPDPKAAAEFYGGLFGWRFDDRMPADADGSYMIGKLRGLDVAAVSSRPQGVPAGPVSWNMYVAVDSADGAAARAEDAGGQVVMEPFDVLDAGRMAVLADPEGAAFCVWQANEHNGAVLVNEPGTWNFSELNARDPEGATRFYGAVFGWEASSFSYGGSEWSMFRMPGYGEFLEQRVPGLRSDMRDQGAPEGFADAVAWLQPMTADQGGEDVAPQWSVTFAVDDADAIAARAAELGGELAVEPFDAGPTRTAVISDPQGAAFSVTKFTPPNE